MIETSIRWSLENFGLLMFFLATLIILIHRKFASASISNAEIVYRWIALLPLGVTGIYAAILHGFFGSMAAANIGWLPSPFQTEVAMANLGFGLIGILSFRASYGFRLATVIGAVCWLFGDALGHIYQMIKFHNFANGNAGTWFWLDIIVPFILVICIIRLRADRKIYKLR